MTQREFGHVPALLYVHTLVPFQHYIYTLIHAHQPQGLLGTTSSILAR